MREVVIVSGKGGTGKTGLAASFGALAENVLLADCDVDAADMEVVLQPEIQREEIFIGGKQAVIDSEKCVGCGRCYNVCRFDAIAMTGPGNELIKKTYEIDEVSCEGCGVCVGVCPVGAIDFVDAVNGKWFISDTRLGPLVHARLGVAQENSGKLVALIRKEAKALASQKSYEWIISDGPPGIGCPVIASIGGVNLAVIVTEPSCSGQHDMQRMVELARHFNVPAAVCVNKWDLNEDVTQAIESYAREAGVAVLGRIHYDKQFTDAQKAGKSPAEYCTGSTAEQIREVWLQITELLEPQRKEQRV